MIDKLTKQQEAMLPVYLDEYLKIGLCTEPCDRVKAEAAIIASYKHINKPVPKFIWVDSPFAGARLAAEMVKGSKNVSKEEILEQISKASYGSFDAYWVSFYAFISEQLPVEKEPLIDLVKEVVKTCGVFFTFEDTVICTERATQIHIKDKQLHNPEGLALEYRDGQGVFALNGVRYPSLLDCIIDNGVAAKEDKKKSA